MEYTMRYPAMILSFSALVLLLASQSSNANEGKKQIKPTQTWSEIADDSVNKLAPKAGYLIDQKEVDKLWTDWGLGEAPAIDFTKEIVFVQIAGGPNIPSVTYFLDAKGNLTVGVAQTLRDGPGFGFSIAVLPKNSIKTYNGKPIEETKDK
jgi:hypothetical protein